MLQLVRKECDATAHEDISSRPLVGGVTVQNSELSLRRSQSNDQVCKMYLQHLMRTINTK